MQRFLETGAVELSFVIAATIFLTGLRVLEGDPYGLGGAIFSILLFLVLLAFVAYSFFSSTGRRILIFSAASTVALAVLAFALTSWRGFPITAPPASNAFSYVLVAAINLIYWFLVCAPLVYGMPFWEKSVLPKKIARNLLGAAFSGWYLLNLALPEVAGGYMNLSKGIGPLDTYFAFADCDSTSFLNGDCLSANASYLVADYFFWILVASLTALIASELLTALRRSRQQSAIERSALSATRKISFLRAGILAVLLAALIAVGLYVVPIAVQNSGVVLPSGTDLSIHIGNWEAVPFTVDHNNSQISGAIETSQPVRAYIAYSTPSHYLGSSFYAVGNGTSLPLNVTLPEGMYYLVFSVPVNKVSIHIKDAIIVR
ncbi:MAG: hypothetical protein ACHQ1H_11845 [Nitrososphaerales archaeon]